MENITTKQLINFINEDLFKNSKVSVSVSNKEFLNIDLQEFFKHFINYTIKVSLCDDAVCFTVEDIEI